MSPPCGEITPIVCGPVGPQVTVIDRHDVIHGSTLLIIYSRTCNVAARPFTFTLTRNAENDSRSSRSSNLTDL
ncbi:hypothetical protein AAFF_G00233100 [Aldrovandia affinis]|uniref:Uncharacterized protein n=1 Tax=Aldrovandia affinis TaxID=143900 RepID=A0AAD7RFJ4_9TELE|nr:hypothetical protein AAFF_G00233100 [Aldrovandia affinis]